MKRVIIALSAVATAAAVVSLPWAWASSMGADPGHSGGPANNALNCVFCHTPGDSFNTGPGGVQVLGFPQRYRPGNLYEITVRVFDAEHDGMGYVMEGAGFEVSAEGPAGHLGTLTISDAVNTRYAGSSPPDIGYVTHTLAGKNASIADWSTNGGSFDYPFLWKAPPTDQGAVRLFASGNVRDPVSFFWGTRYYVNTATSRHAIPGDADGDDDMDLADFALIQQCFNTTGVGIGDPCEFTDVNRDTAVGLSDLTDFVAAMSGPSDLPPAYVLASSVRGGRVYDSWWLANGAPAPTGDHPLYPAVGIQTGASTYRCKECHGWDYKGRDGAYASGSHFTDIPGVLGTTLGAQEMFDLLKADPAVVPNGHDMDAYGMTDADVWDVVKMVRESLIDTDTYISAGAFLGDPIAGQDQFDQTCAKCHGLDGRSINFKTPPAVEYVGTVASGNPWEFIHKVRFGQPAAPMLGYEHLFFSTQLAADVGSYAATLPVN